MPQPLERRKLETRIRTLTVKRVADVTPKMRRVTLSGPDLVGFNSPGHADHVKLFFPADPQVPVVPVLGPEGLSWPDDQPKPSMRDYTPRRHDPVANELDIDFVLHGDGPASGWAAQARPGQTIVLGGPRGTLVMPDDFAWYLLIGDETALPAIGRRLEELPAGCRAIALIEIDDDGERQEITSRADAEIHWLSRNGAPAGTGTRLLDRLAGMRLPAGDGHAFAAAEGAVTKAIRAHLLEARGLPPAWVRAAGYWLREVADARAGIGFPDAPVAAAAR